MQNKFEQDTRQTCKFSCQRVNVVVDANANADVAKQLQQPTLKQIIKGGLRKEINKFWGSRVNKLDD